MNADDAQEWADLAEPEDPRTTMQQVFKWRKEPPTVDEVKAYSWWWNKPENGNPPHVLHLDTADGFMWDVDDESGEAFNPKYWPGEWAPAVPPP